MIQLRLGVTGMEQLKRSIGARSDAVKDLSPAWRKIAKFLFDYEAKVFKAGGAHDGLSGWAPRRDGSFSWKRHKSNAMMSPKWKTSKAGGLYSSIKRRDAGHPILIKTGRLMNSLSYDSSHYKSSPDQIVDITPKSLRWGTSVPYAIYHQKGTKNKNGGVKMVARPPLRLTETARRDITTILTKYMRESGQFRRASLGSEGAGWRGGDSI